MGDLGKLFSSPAVMEVLSVFAQYPDNELYQTQIKDLTNSSLVQVQRALARLELTGLVGKMKEGNRVYYLANRNHPAFDGIKEALLRTVVYGEAIKTV